MVSVYSYMLSLTPVTSNGVAFATVLLIFTEHRSPMALLRRSSWRLPALSWRSHDASTAYIELSRRALCVCTARSRRSHGVTAFCLHSYVFEITDDILISQLIHEPMILTMHHVCIRLAMLCSNQEATTPWGLRLRMISTSSCICRTCIARQAVALLDGVHQ